MNFIKNQISSRSRSARYGKKAVASFELVMLIASLFAFSFMMYSATPVSAQTALSQPSACCEKTKDGAFCINADEAKCNDNFKVATTSCETTSYCKLGTCYDSEEGICMENTPLRVCNENGGTWDARGVNEVPQCQLGCCIIADQAAFVPLVRCKRLSTLFGVENNYRTDINSEVACIAAAQSQDKGACVYEKDFERFCQFTTRAGCGAGNKVEEINGTGLVLSDQRNFYKDFLCSAEELNTACAKQTSTTCSQGEVYWVDSCGNLENVYSSNREKSWNSGMVVEAGEICDANSGNNKNCGNCDYLLGTRCAKWDGLLGIGKPEGSDYYCQKTECTDRDGDKRINGESWCVYDSQVGNSTDLVGSRYYREVCRDGKVRVEACEDYRNQVCLEGSISTSIGAFETAACRVNRWQDCIAQTKDKDCLNIDKRDCNWLPSIEGLIVGGSSSGSSGKAQAFSNPTGNAFPSPTGNVVAPITGNALFGGDDKEESVEETTTNRAGGVCVPNFAPGLKFWEEGSAQATCGQANARCVVQYEKGLLGGEKVVSGGDCLTEEWALAANRICAGLGDCGGYINYNNKYTDDGYVWLEDGKEKKFAPNTVNIISGGFTGMVISALTGRVVDTSNDAAFAAKTQGGDGSAPAASGDGTASVVAAGGMATTAVQGWEGFLGKAPAKGITPVNPPVTEVTTAVTKTPLTGTTLAGAPLLKSGASVGSGTYTAGTLNYAGTSADKAGFITLAKGQTATVSGTGIDSTLVVKDAAGNTLQTVKNAGDITAGAGVEGAVPKGSSYLSEFLGVGGGSGLDAIFSGFQWAAIAYGVGYLAGSLLGMSDNNVQALSTALAAGAFAYKALSTWGQTSSTWLANPLVGVGVAVLVFVIMYKTEDTKVVTFECKPWQAPSGGNDCEVCNDDTLPCSEYRCKSLGQNCEIENVGTNQERCVNVNPRDVNPPVITPNQNELTNGHNYINVKNSPPGPGFEIIKTNSSDGCLKAFTPLKFGINTNEPSQCKIDFNHTTKFDDMVAYFGGSNLYAYNHTEQFSLPGASAFKNSSLTLANGKDLVFYIRCKDKNGNENDAEYAVKMCIDPSPDNTAPQVKATSVTNGGCVAENQNTVSVEFYTNEPADCRWSPQDQSYGNMQGEMSCSNLMYQVNAAQLFTCRAALSGIARDEATFYVRCRDQPGANEANRNENRESFVFKLRGSTALKMKNLQPNATIFGAVSPAPVELYVETLFGCNDGQSICYYSTTGREDDYIMFFDTNTEDGISTQRQDLIAGNQKFFIKCIDAGGNLVEDTLKFKLDIDTNAPVIARVYEEEQMLKIVTVRDSECAYTFTDCDFTFAEGTQMPYANSTVHVAEWNKDKTYYIKCRDEFRNEDADCSAVVRPSQNFL